MTHRLLSVGPALRIHLEQTKIDAKLDLLHTIAPCEAAHDDLPGLIIPIVEERRDIEVHRRGVWPSKSSSQRVAEKTHSQIARRIFKFLFSPRRALRHARAMAPLPKELVLQHVRAALAEDIGPGDATTLA